MSYADVLSLFPLPVFSSVLEDVDGEEVYENLKLEKFNETSQAQSQEDSTNSYITEDLYLLEKYSELKNSNEKNLEVYVKKVLNNWFCWIYWFSFKQITPRKKLSNFWCRFFN